MIENAFADAAVVLVGHGATDDTGSAAAVYQHATELRRRRVVAEVCEGFWKQEPRVQDVLARLAVPRVFLVPLFMSEGHFSQVIIPRSLGLGQAVRGKPSRVRQAGGRALFYCRPIGTHVRMAEVVLARAREVLDRFPFPHVPKPSEASLFIAGHGTQRNENSREAIERQVGRVRSDSDYADVHGIYLEENPPIGACYALARTRNLVLVPFFASSGPHVREDIPRLLGEPEGTLRQRQAAGQGTWRNPTERNGKRVWIADCVGTASQVVEIILDRLEEAAAEAGPRFS